MTNHRRAVLGWYLVVAVAAVAASASSLSNGFAFDDVAIIVENPRVTTLRPLHQYFAESYWPPAAGDGQYRPVTVATFALTWALGAGSPLLFHLVSVVLKVLAAVAFLAVSRALLPSWAALAGALVFAVHPVHSEAVGNVVGQGELHATLAALLALGWYLRARRRGPLPVTTSVGIAALAAYGLLAKEQGLVLPATLLAAELLLLPAGAGGAERFRRAGPTLALAVATVAVIWAVRSAVAGGSAGPIAWPWRGLGHADRVVTVVGLVPEYLRLLLWPWKLRVDYSPPAFPVASGIGLPHGLGAAALVIGGLAWKRTRREGPVVAFGLAWAALAWLPVSSLVIPTGFVVAERALFQPSAGVALAVGGLLAMAAERWAAPRPARILLAMAGVAVVAFLGRRSASRMPVWRSNETVVRQMIEDEPRSYYAHYNLALLHEEAGRPDSAEHELQRAIALWDGDGRLLEYYAQVLWRQRRHAEMVPLLARSLALDERRSATRVLLYETLTLLGRSVEARGVALRGIEIGDPAFRPKFAPARSR